MRADGVVHTGTLSGVPRHGNTNPVKVLFIAGFGPVIREAEPSRRLHRRPLGRDSWPGDIPLPQAWLEFEVDSVEEATAALERRGYRILIRVRKEPWGQTVSRFMSPEGLLLAVKFTASMREAPADVR